MRPVCNMMFSTYLALLLLFVTQIMGAAGLPSTPEKNVSESNSSITEQIVITTNDSLVADVSSWKKWKPPTGWKAKIPEIGRKLQKHAGDALDIIGHVGTSAPFGRMRDAMGRPAVDFWKTLEGLGDKARKYAEDRLNELAHDPVIIARIQEIRSVYSELVDAGKDLQIQVNNVAQAQNIDSNDILRDLEKLLADVFEKLKSEFPPPDHAPRHEERQQNVHKALADVEAALTKFLQERGMSEEQVRAQLDKLMPLIERVTVMIGDLIEQHPIIFEILLFTLSIPLTEVLILRPILSVIGFGPYGPVKGSIAAWAQRVFFGGAVKEGSWFALLQKAGMSRWSGFWKMIGVGAGLATIGKLFSGFSPC